MLNRLTRLLYTTTPTAQTTMIGRVVPTVPTALASFETTSKHTEGSGKVEVATFANGCFWGTQQIFDKHYGTKHGLISTNVGYTGGDDKYKGVTYRQVCSGETGFAEACRVEFDPDLVGYAELVEFFYRTHDPTTKDRQGNDTGTQYRSAIFTHSPEQEEIAKRVTQEVDEKYFAPKGKKIVTLLEPAREWYTAEAYHQKYLDNNPSGYHCFTHRLHW
ncbi:Peptide-methionine (S)-S-oxide reductase [Tulasnella sp. 403]|nr:Peptide-methionine (S)-S-oxide reductase [Tulasnella sp. 403]